MILAFQLEAMNHSDGDIIAKWITCVAVVVKMRTIVCICGWTLAGPPMCQLLVSGVWPTEGILLSWPNREKEFVFVYIYLKKANPKRRQNSQETVNFIITGRVNKLK